MSDICLCGIVKEDCDYHRPAAISAVPWHNVSGTCFIPGVTQFTVENLFDALELIRKTDSWEDFTLDVHAALHSRLRKNNLLDCDNGQWSLIGMKVNSVNEGKNGGVFDSVISHADGRKVILRTREH